MNITLPELEEFTDANHESLVMALTHLCVLLHDKGILSGQEVKNIVQSNVEYVVDTATDQQVSKSLIDLLATVNDD